VSGWDFGDNLLEQPATQAVIQQQSQLVQEELRLRMGAANV
jgi:hypothetical protein